MGRIEILSIEEPRPHEETSGQLVPIMKQRLLATGYFMDPIILDSSTKTLLDGMHRFATYKEFGAGAVPVYLTEYKDSSIKVSRWARIARGVAKETIKLVLEEFDVEEIGNIHDGIKFLKERGRDFALITKERCYVSKNASDNKVEAYGCLRKFEDVMRIRCKSFEVISDSRIRENLDGDSLILLPAPIKKDDVVYAARSQNLFPNKSTRHLIPYRPMNVRIPLSLLTEESSIEEKNTRLEQLISKMSCKVMRGFMRGDRRYEEPVVIYE